MQRIQFALASDENGTNKLLYNHGLANGLRAGRAAVLWGRVRPHASACYGRQTTLKPTGACDVFPFVSLTAIDVGVPFVLVVGSVTVNVPPALPLAGATDAWAGDELTAVKVVTPGSLAVKF